MLGSTPWVRLRKELTNPAIKLPNRWRVGITGWSFPPANISERYLGGGLPVVSVVFDCSTEQGQFGTSHQRFSFRPEFAMTMSAYQFFEASTRRISGCLRWLASWRLVQPPKLLDEPQRPRDWLVYLVSRRPSDEELLAQLSCGPPA